MDVSKSLNHNYSMPMYTSIQSGAHQKQVHHSKKEDSKNADNGVTLDLSSMSSNNKLTEIEKQFLARKENLQKQIDSLSLKITDAKNSGNEALHDELLLKAKDLSDEILQLDQEKAAAIMEEQKRQLEEAEKKNKEKEEKMKEENKKFKSEKENEESKEAETFEFFATADKSFSSIQNNKILKAKMESTKTRLETEMATDAARLGDHQQAIRAAKSAEATGISSVPWVSGKSFTSELKRIAIGAYKQHEGAKANELAKLSAGINTLEFENMKKLSELNKSSSERVEDEKEEDSRDKKEDSRSNNENEE